MSGSDVSPDLIEKLRSRFYPMGCRDDGLWHLLRTPTAPWWINGQVIAAAATFTTPNILGLGAWQIPTNATGVILSCAISSNPAGGRVYVCNGDRNPSDGADMPLGTVMVADEFIRQWVTVLFGLDGSLEPDGTVRFGAFAQQCTLYATPIGYQA